MIGPTIIETLFTLIRHNQTKKSIVVGSRLARKSNIRLGWELQKGENTLAYYNMELNMVLKKSYGISH